MDYRDLHDMDEKTLAFVNAKWLRDAMVLKAKQEGV